MERIGQIAIPVQDLDRAVAFYRDALGMPFLFRTPALAFFDCSGTRIMLSEPEGPGATRQASIVYYAVEDLKEAYDQHVGRGVAFIDAPRLIARLADREVWMPFFYDSEDNALALMSESPIAS